MKAGHVQSLIAGSTSRHRRSCGGQTLSQRFCLKAFLVPYLSLLIFLCLSSSVHADNPWMELQSFFGSDKGQIVTEKEALPRPATTMCYSITTLWKRRIRSHRKSTPPTPRSSLAPSTTLSAKGCQAPQPYFKNTLAIRHNRRLNTPTARSSS